jgi:diguanylate cyclase (GGDEF)-like protein/PAS domain S-box-containing protein
MESVYSTIFNASGIGVCIIQNNQIRLANPAALRLLEYPLLTDLVGVSLEKVVARTDYPVIASNESLRLTRENVPGELDFTLIRRINNPISVKGYFTLIDFQNQPATLLQFMQSQPCYPVPNDLAAECLKYKEVIDTLPDVVFEIDLTGKVIFSNQKAYEFFGVSREEYREMGGDNAFDFVIPSDLERIKQNIAKMFRKEPTSVSEYAIRRQNGSMVPVIIHSIPVFEAGKPVGLRGIIIDISERKQMEERINYLSRSDALTALYNRTFFEKELQRLKNDKILFALVICDLDGLKLVNDTMGLRCGDQIIISTAQAIRETFSERLCFRIGGDEFAIIVDNPDETAIKNSIRELQKRVAVSNREITKIPITLSCGYAISEDGLTEPEKLYMEADNYMIKKKLFHSQSNHSSVIQALTKALEARDFITEGHAERMHSLVWKLAAQVGLSELRQTNLRLFAQFHDIGKVGIPDHILFKNAALTPEEKELMNRHSEIGFRIAQTAPDLAHIADWILKHHEWWNGRGYPLGISGEAIPLECRILSIVDAFDAMTHDRPYRKALPVAAALTEIEKFSGVQFDPELAPIFIQLCTNSKAMETEAG